MCLACPGRVTAIEGKDAVVDILGVKRRVSIELFPDVALGDYLMVHAGYVIERVDMEEAERAIELYRELGSLMNGDDGR